jgi:hypothetical protein
VANLVRIFEYIRNISMEMMTKEQTWEKLRKLRLVFGKMPKGKWSHGGLGAANENGMSGFDLKGADFSGAYLGAANFSGAILKNASFSGAELYEAKFNEANLIGANLSRSDLYKADFTLANLSDADLQHACLLNATLSAVNLNRANLQESILEEVNLNRADLSGADITGSTFWGVSSAGWKIEGIRAQYVYFCENVKSKKENYRRDFKAGQFEALYKSLPTVEIIFEEGISPAGLLTLSLLVERINGQNPNLGVRMTDIRKNEFETRVGLKLNKDEDLSAVGQLMQEVIAQVASEVLPEVVSSYMARALPNNIGELSKSILKNPSSPIVFNVMQPTFQFIKADGSVLSGAISQSGAMLNSDNVVIKNYGSKKEKVDRLFVDLKKSFDEYDESMRNTLTETTDRIIEAIRKGEDTSYLQNLWEEIKEGVKTGGAAATIATAIARLLGLL